MQLLTFKMRLRNDVTLKQIITKLKQELRRLLEPRHVAPEGLAPRHLATRLGLRLRHRQQATRLLFHSALFFYCLFINEKCILTLLKWRPQKFAILNFVWF